MNLKSRFVQVRDVGDVAREQVVDADDRVAAIEQGLGEMRPDEAGRAGDDDSLFHGMRSPRRLTPNLNAGTRTQYACFWKKPFTTRQPHDLEVERDRPVLDVVEVVLDALLDRRVAAPAVDLRPAGQARAHLVAQHVLRDPLLELVDEERPLGPRADERHVAAQHVPELRQLVDVGAPQQAADRRAARVVVCCAQTGPVSRSASWYIERNL